MKSLYCLFTVNFLLLNLEEVISTSSPFFPEKKDGSVIQSKLRELNQLIHEFEELTSNLKCFDNYQNFHHNTFIRDKYKNIDQLVHELQDLTSNLKCYNDDFPNKRPKDCYDLKKNGITESGIYQIWPAVVNGLQTNDIIFQVYCDMDTDGGGWTVFQRRGNFGNLPDYFYRDWKSYAEGFGELDGEFWLGNDKLHTLTNQDSYSLRVDLKDDNGDRRYAQYKKFKIENKNEKYKLHVEGYTGNAGDSLAVHSGKRFYTKDDDTDYYKCAKTYKGAWWYNACHTSNLNGISGEKTFGVGINWLGWKGYYYSIPYTEMKIRPMII